LISVYTLRTLGKNLNLFKLPALKPLRAALHPLIEEQMKNYDTTNKQQSNDKSNRNRGKKRKHDDDDGALDLLREQRRKMEALEEEYINQTQLRALRTKQLDALNEQGFALRVPDGVAICDTPADGTSTSGALLLEGGRAEPEVAKRVLNPISCYICHKPYLDLHFFYHQLCPDCASFNYGKRNEMADMKGLVCIVTGARCKIGYRSALKLLRCGASVIATTRFPADAAQRYADEEDSAVWSSRLHIYGLDFRDIALLENFCSFVMNNYDRLDVIINNACQTIRRPPAYYSHLIGAEKEYQHRLEGGSASTPAPADSAEPRSADEKMDDMLRQQFSFASSFATSFTASVPQIGTEDAVDVSSSSEPSNTTSAAAVARSNAAADADIGQFLSSSDMTQMPVAPGDSELDPELFPTGILDVNRQQIDLRKKNSWTMKLHEISTPELAEVFAINAMAPAILNARLKPLMEKFPKDFKFIVNVSAMEGKFYRFKSDSHPHTNMAKAALNMMTRTSAQDYFKSNIYMTAVDTGWINDEKPAELAVAHEKKHKFQTPLDEIDAASRVLDPVIGPLHARDKGEMVEPPWGLFLKDYMKCEW
jgi:NAD(P)-dependent dehydrogenase (short-subunit alcohol dehydrogenase family)